jgi:hypothetical protein
MTLLRRSLWVFLVLAVLYSALWLVGLLVIQTVLDRIKPAKMSAVDELLLDEFSVDEVRFNFASRAVGGYPFGYAITLDQPSLKHPLVTWQAEESVVARWSLFRPFTVDVDYSGSHAVVAVLQPPMRLSADQAQARIRIQPLPSARTGRLSLVSTRGEGAGLAVSDRPIFSVNRFAFELDIAEEAQPGDMMVDAYGLALSDDPAVQARYQALLQQMGNAESMLSALGLGLDLPVDHVRMRANIRPFFPLAGSQVVLPAFISRGGNVKIEVLDVQQGSWRGRVAAHAMFGPDGRLMMQICPLLRAGASYVPIPLMSIFTLYAGARGVDVSREPIPAFALPKSVEPFTQRELCNGARTYVFEDEG